MNPLCCIAPVSIDRDRGNNPVGKSQPGQLGVDGSIRSVSYGSKPSLSAQVSSVGTESEKASAVVNHCEVEETVVVSEGCNRDLKVFGGGGGGSVAGILYKWVNYGKGWRSRWFVLEDGVLSYYKVHGPDKILMSPAREKGVRVIGEDSLRYMKKANWNSSSSSSSNRLGASARPCKPFGEVHLKVCNYALLLIFLQFLYFVQLNFVFFYDGYEAKVKIL